MKTCRNCKIEKFYEDFYRDRSKSDGYSSWCKTCHSSRPLRNRTKYFQEYNRQARPRRYGISASELELMYALQDYKCFICKEEKPLVIDHNHETGQVRRLLCNYCNMIVGIIETHPSRLSQAYKYVLEQ